MSDKRQDISISKHQARRLLAEPPGGDFIAALRTVLKGHRINGWLTISNAAQLAVVSVRTLQRRLAAEELTFSELIDQVRAELAMEMLSDRHFSLDQIRNELGYSALPNFSRAFQRWTGKTPSEYRRSQS